MIYVIITIALILLYMKFETTFLSTSLVNFSSDTNGLKVVHLSDIHINKFYVSKSKLLSRLDQVNPDIIVMSGDYIETYRDIPKFIAFLTLLSENYPVYLTFGNHDHKALYYNTNNKKGFIDKIQAAGGKVLLNSNTKILKNGISYNLIGVDDIKRGKPDIEKAFLGVKASNYTGCINIVVSHNPDIVFDLPADKVDYLLCGHFHGGQIWMPFNIEFKLMRKEKLCRKKCFRGLHKINDINLYINRGLGNVIFPFRFFSIPEMAVIQLPGDTVTKSIND